MKLYSWQQKDWPHFTYSLLNIEEGLFVFAEKIGKVTAILNALPENTKVETIINMMVSEAIKTSEIEGEYLSRKDVMSSIKNNLGLNHNYEKVKSKQAEGIGELMIDVRNDFREKLSQEKLFAWHRMLLKGNTDINVGTWRDHEEPMQNVSGPLGKQRVHYEGPPSDRSAQEIEKIITWFYGTWPGWQERNQKGS